MCGICGIAGVSPSELIDQSVLVRMRDVMQYRGPDDGGSYIGNGIGLAMRRLSIIDIASGRQPMSNHDGSLWIVFNGEIYNYLELRKQHLASYLFKTQSDTEVILHLYEKFGADCVKHLNGMFAFAIWDTRREELFLARDRVGVKPLYYTIARGTLLFASEIKSLLQHPDVSVSVASKALDEFMTFGYVQTPDTIIPGIHRMPEGHIATWRHGQLHLRPYWDLKFEETSTKNEQESMGELMDLFKDSIRLRLRSDVPVGVLLSGGIDSSAVTAMLAKSKIKVDTFSIGFDEGPAFNELAYARQIAREFGTNHHETIVSAKAFTDCIPTSVYHMDEPVSDGAAIPLYFVSALASKHVKVVLSGEGSDELFGGYPIYRYMALLEQYRRLPQWIRAQVTDPMLSQMPPGAIKIKKYASLARIPLEKRYLGPNLYDREQRGSLYSADLRATLNGYDAVDAVDPIWKRTRGFPDALSKMLYADIKTWLPNDLLIKADRMTMAHSIELRVPFLDYRLIEFAATLPSNFKIRGNQTKFILKQALNGVLPKNIIHRPKAGFPTPLARILRGPAASYMRDTLLSPTSIQRGNFQPQFVSSLIHEHVNGIRDHYKILWRMVVLEEWHRHFVDGVAVNARSPSPAASDLVGSSPAAVWREGQPQANISG
jgi:asparagine synthase (glutamine-hydrolysing)